MILLVTEVQPYGPIQEILSPQTHNKVACLGLYVSYYGNLQEPQGSHRSRCSRSFLALLATSDPQVLPLVELRQGSLADDSPLCYHPSGFIYHVAFGSNLLDVFVGQQLFFR